MADQDRVEPKRPRLCLYTKTWRPSGTGLFAQELALALVEQGAELTLVCPRVDDDRIEGERSGLRRIRPPRELTGSHGRLHRALVSLLRIFGSFLGLIMARFRARHFIVTIPDPLPIAVAMLFLLRLSGARIIYIAHDPLPHAFRLSPRWRWLEIWAHGLCYDLATTVVVLSEPSRAELIKAFPETADRSAVIDHGVFVLPGCGSPPGNGQLLCFGTIRRNKHVLEAIEAIGLVRRQGIDASLLIAGEPHREDPLYAVRCQQLAEAAGEGIDWRPGYLDDAALPAVVAQCDAFLMPYGDFHSQSGVAMLAASNGWPVIATDAGGLSTLVTEGLPVQTIVWPVTAQSIAAAIAAFFSTPIKEWRARAVAYQQITLAHRSWPVIAERYLEIVRSL